MGGASVNRSVIMVAYAVLLLLLASISGQAKQISAHRINATPSPYPVYNRTIEELNHDVNDMEHFQEDIVLTNYQWELIKSRKALPFESYRWTEKNGFPHVPYLFQDSVDKAAVRAGVNHWKKHTCITFSETTNTNQRHIKFFKGSGCWSNVGMIPQNGQQISLADGCAGLGTIAHEIGHALGFWHEQSRSDRDNYVTIKTDNIKAGTEGNFGKAQDNNYGVIYDYTSDMHYGGRDFSANGKFTIVTKDPLAQELIGAQDRLSHRDILMANKMYKCIDKWLAKCGLSSDPCQNEGFTGASCQCVCPPGTSGNNCQNVVNDYYANSRSANTEKITTEKTLTSSKGSGLYTKWIVAPECKHVKLTFTQFELYEKTNNGATNICYWEYLTLRMWLDISKGLTYCAKMITVGRSFISKEREMILHHGNNGPNTPGWKAKVEFVPDTGCTPAVTTTATTTTTTTTPKTTSKADKCAKKPKTHVLGDGEEMSFENPGSPSPAKGKNKCGWKFQVGPNADLEISCPFFSIQEQNSKKKCKKSYFKIDKEKFCGPSRTLGPVKAKSKTVTITYKSKKAKSDTFMCTATAVTKTTTAAPTTPSSQSCLTEGSTCDIRVGSEAFRVKMIKRSWEECKADCSSMIMSMAEPADPQALADYLSTNGGAWRYWLGGKGQCTGTAAQCKSDSRPFKWLSGADIPWSAPWYGSPQSAPKSHAVMLRAYNQGDLPLMVLAPHAPGYCICQ